MAKPRPKSAKHLKAAKDVLLAKRAELQAQVTELERVAETSSEMADTPDEFGDSGAATFERERDLSLAENLREMLDKVDHALGKIDDRTYGICESCGKSIEAARIKALPYAHLCIECARRQARTSY